MGLFYGDTSITGYFTTQLAFKNEVDSVEPDIVDTTTSKYYGISLASEMLDEVLYGSLTNVMALNITGNDVSEDFENYEYKPADIKEYFQNVLTADNVNVQSVLTNVLG